MTISRRDFLKMGGAAVAGMLLPVDLAAAAKGGPHFPLHKRVGEATSVCPYCSVGCGLLIATDAQGHVTNCEGDPDNIHNRGALDPKSVSITQLSNSPRRLKTVQYRAPGSDQWEEKTWDWAMQQIAQRVKTTRDATFEKKDDKGVTVNRTQGIAWLGGAANNNEDCYVAAKFSRALGLVFIEHQARI